MSRRTLAVLVIGWLLGIATAFGIPTLVYQRQSLWVRWPHDVFPGVGGDKLIEAINQGWIVTQQGGYQHPVSSPGAPHDSHRTKIEGEPHSSGQVWCGSTTSTPRG